MNLQLYNIENINKALFGYNIDPIFQVYFLKYQMSDTIKQYHCFATFK